MNILKRAQNMLAADTAIESTGSSKSKATLSKRLSQIAASGAVLLSLSACAGMPGASPNGFGQGMFQQQGSSRADEQYEKQAIMDAVNQIQHSRNGAPIQVRWTNPQNGDYGVVRANRAGTNRVGDLRFGISSSARIGGQVRDLRDTVMVLDGMGNLAPERRQQQRYNNYNNYNGNSGGFSLRRMLGDDYSSNNETPEAPEVTTKLG